jgi:ligand-binding sensor domain-containing protein
LWIGTNNGLYYSKDGNSTYRHVENGLGHYNIQSLLENNRGELWIGSAAGYLTKFDGKEFVIYSLTDDESGDSRKYNVHCREIK